MLKFSPYAWAKLCYLRDKGPTEVGFVGVEYDPLKVVDVRMMYQECDAASCDKLGERWDEWAIEMADLGIPLDAVKHIDIHTHPGNSANPSSVDEGNWRQDAFFMNDYQVFFIIADGGHTYARIRYNYPVCSELEIPVEVDYSMPFPASDQDAWDAEYEQYLTEIKWVFTPKSNPTSYPTLITPKSVDKDAPFFLPDTLTCEVTPELLQEILDKHGVASPHEIPIDKIDDVEKEFGVNFVDVEDMFYDLLQIGIE